MPLEFGSAKAFDLPHTPVHFKSHFPIPLRASTTFCFRFVGAILRLKCFNHIHDKEYYSDGEFIEPPEDYDFTTRVGVNLRILEQVIKVISSEVNVTEV